MDDIPTNRVIELKQQKVMDSQIIQMLEQEGYMPSQILEALNQAKLKGQITGRTIEGEIPQNAMPEQQMQQQTQPEQMMQDGNMQQGQIQVDEFNMPQGTVELLQEISEKIIEEKWQVLYQDVMQIFNWKTKVESRLAEIESKLNTLNGQINSVQESIVGKLKEYDTNMQDVGADVKAMDKVFKNILPELKTTINDLDKVAKKFKDVEGKK